MREGDRSKVHSVMRDDARLIKGYTGENTLPVVTEDDFHAFLAAVGSKHEVTRDERVLSYEIKIDDDPVQVWTTYVFYAGTQFSHCGVDAFQLVRDASGWKILNFTDTRRTKNCR